MTTTLEQAKARIEQLEAEFGGDHEFVADALLDYAKILRQNNALLEAVNIEAKAKVIKSRIGFGDPNTAVAPVAEEEEEEEEEADDLKKCPMCAERIKAEAKICRFCKCSLQEIQEPPKPESNRQALWLAIPVTLIFIFAMAALTSNLHTGVSSRSVQSSSSFKATSYKLAQEKARDLLDSLNNNDWRKAREHLEQGYIQAQLSEDAELVRKFEKLRDDFYRDHPQQ